MVIQIQNFYKTTITRNWSASTGDFNVSTKPTIISGYLVVSPNNPTLREVIKYSATGTNAYGDFITISNLVDRGLGGTTAQTHTIGEALRMNITSEHWKDLNATIDSIIAVGAPNADTITKGLVEIATDTEVTLGTNIGITGASLVATPSQIKTKLDLKALSTDIQTFLTSATWTKPIGAKSICVQLWAAGGGGALAGFYGGGGGGAYNTFTFLSSQVGTTASITVGFGGGPGMTGGNSSFGSLLLAYGGAGVQSSNAGGGGGGIGSNTNTSDGGSPMGGSIGTSTVNPGVSIFGGGGGGYSGASGGVFGAESIYGGGGGGGDNGNGGRSYFGGGGGARITGGQSILGGSGGSIGNQGSVPGGGASYGSKGGNGKVIITTYF